MKKSTVVKLYNELDNKEILKKGLPRIINVKGYAEDIFYDLCIKYNDILFYKNNQEKIAIKL